MVLNGRNIEGVRAGVKLKYMNNQLEIFEIPSPCIGVCEVNNKGFCKGCFRSRDERLHWLQLSSEQKREVIRLCQSRRTRVMRARQEALEQQSRSELTGQGSLF
jgi:predicted Fe-S protein YdhL (DUF1289 family)